MTRNGFLLQQLQSDYIEIPIAPTIKRFRRPDGSGAWWLLVDRVTGECIDTDTHANRSPVELVNGFYEVTIDGLEHGV